MNKIDDKLRFKSGIYYFCNLTNGKRYVGSSVNIYNRLHEHLHNLRGNKSHNQHFQNAWCKYGEDSFIYGVLEFCDPEIRFDREQHYIDSLCPEYNLTNNVVANFGHSPTDECRQKISETLKQKYASGEIQTYRQDHAWKHSWVYDVNTYSLYKEYKCIADAARDLGVSNFAMYKDRRCVLQQKYGLLFEQPKTELDRINIINQVYRKYIGGHEYFIVLYKGFYLYFSKLTDFSTLFNLSRSMIHKHQDATIDNPYIPTKCPDIKIFFSDTFIPNTAVYTSEVYKLLSGNIGKTPEMDNTEINSEIKESESSYSVESETEKNIISPRVSDIQNG